MLFSILGLGSWFPNTAGAQATWSIEQFIERVLEVSPELEQAVARLEAARANSVRSHLPLVPNVSAQFRYSRLSAVDNSPLVPGFTGAQLTDLESQVSTLTDPSSAALWTATLAAQRELADYRVPSLRNQTGLRLSVSYPILRALISGLPAARAAREVVEAREALRDAARSQIVLLAQQSYYQRIRAEEAQGIAADSREAAEAHHLRMEAMNRAGAAGGIDLLRVRAQLAVARVAEVNAEVARSRAREDFRSLAGIDATQAGENRENGEDGEGEMALPELSPASAVGPTGEVLDLVAFALAHRHDLRAANHLIRAGERSVAAHRGRHLPSLGLVANVDVANPNERFVPQEDRYQTSWDVSAVMQWSPNEAVEVRQAVREASAELDERRSQRAALERAIRAEVRHALVAREAARTALEAAEVGVEAAEASHRGRFAALRSGSSVHSELIDARVELRQARLQLLDARIAVRLANAHLVYALGGRDEPSE